jgi:LmbE family N-acetylglucosaminyl deacetylase
VNRKNVLAVFAHPDDETFRAGGTLALLAARGTPVQVLTASRGEAGSCGAPALCTPDELPIVREQELRCACQALGLAPPILLTFPDGALSSINPNEILSSLLEVIDRIQPQSIISFGKDGISGHPDHIAVGKSALMAFRKRETIQTYYTLAVSQSIADELGMTQVRALPDNRITHTIDVSSVWEFKLKAIRCHQTQAQESSILKADHHKQRLFLGKEHFRLAEIRNNGTNGNAKGFDILASLAD